MAGSNTKKTPSVQSTRQQLDELDALLQKMLALPVAAGDSAVEEETEPVPVPAPAVAPSRAAENPVLPRRVSLRPVQQAAEPAVPPPASQAETTLGPRVVPAEASVPQPEPDSLPPEWVPLRGNWQPSSQTWGPLADMFRQQQETSDRLETPDEEQGVIRETVMLPMPPASPASPTPATRRRPEPEPDAGEIPSSSMEAMARLELARRAAQQPAPANAPAPAAVPPPLPLSTQLLPEAEKPGGRGVVATVVLSPFLLVNGVYDVVTYPLGPIGRWLRDGGRGALALVGGIFLVATSAILALDWFDWTW